MAVTNIAYPIWINFLDILKRAIMYNIYILWESNYYDILHILAPSQEELEICI